MVTWNEDYQKRNADTVDIIPPFKARAANCGIEFRLATKDPNGNCTNGIEHIVTPLTYNAGDNSKYATSGVYSATYGWWPVNKYLNIWTAATLANSQAAAYAYYPPNTCPSCGVLSISSYIGGKVTGNYGQARIISHETGHCFNLQHCWGNTNNPGVSCGDDGVSDTPITMGWSGCPAATPPNYPEWVVCNAGVIENVQNYMEYSYCARMFTTGQKNRMTAALNSDPSLINMQSAANATATGTTDPYDSGYAVGTRAFYNYHESHCTPVADFHSSRQVICVGDSVSFTDFSYRGIPTSWSWTFTGGTPSTSTAASPSVHYFATGSYTVTLVSTNAAGSSVAKTKTNYIVVLDSTAGLSLDMEGFEGSFPPANAAVQNPKGGNNWVHYTATGHTGTACMRVVNIGSAVGSLAEYITPAYSFVGVTVPTVTFWVAHSLYTSDTTRADALNVSYSTNCGQGWTQRSHWQGSALTTSSPRSTNASYVPHATDWKQFSVSAIAAILTNKPNVRFKFENVSASGNNTYIDDININGWNVGIEESDGETANFEVYPNPAKNNATVELNLTRTSEVKMELYDLTGRKIADIVNNDRMIAGTYRFSLNYPLQDGVYFIQMTSGNSVSSKRLIILN